MWTQSIAAVAGALALGGCMLKEEEGRGESYELSFSACQLQSDVTINGEPAGLSSCRARWDSDSRIVTWQLAAGGAGSWLEPGPGWINLSLAGESAEDTTLAISTVVSPLPASVAPDQVVVAIGTQGGGRKGALGSITVGSNIIDPNGGGGALEANLAAATVSDGSAFGGSFLAVASPVESGSGGSGGASGACFSSSQCDQWVAACEAGAIGPCYCAAACVCAAACDTACQQENHNLAGEYPCPY